MSCITVNGRLPAIMSCDLYASPSYTLVLPVDQCMIECALVSCIMVNGRLPAIMSCDLYASPSYTLVLPVDQCMIYNHWLNHNRVHTCVMYYSGRSPAIVSCDLYASPTGYAQITTAGQSMNDLQPRV